MDQLVLFMALAHGRSEVLCNKESTITSLHLETAIHFTKLLTGASFTVSRRDSGARLVTCDGIGWVNGVGGAADDATDAPPTE
mmetsp:Transcript_20308/g.52663  ORF Transcript_20308/g.52663 Transcript_20308/m.52663 type:complete len:83 (-) Transcript_20308:733-981(-)